jgi:hypothetical protein
MGNLVESMAQEFYGYGRWEAPYWFIGPEQGGEGNETRAKAFSKLGKDGLCDCKEFHVEIGELRWHRELPERAALQPTWRRLMLLLMPSLRQDSDQMTLRRFQRSHWGMRNSGETCVIELGGLAAKSLRTPSDRKSFRQQRFEQIKERIEKCESGPRLVVMYGFGAEKQWKRLSGCDLRRWDVVRSGRTLFALMPGPTAPGQNDEDWIEVGARIAKQL